MTPYNLHTLVIEKEQGVLRHLHFPYAKAFPYLLAPLQKNETFVE